MIAVQCIFLPLGAEFAKQPDLVWDGDTVISDNQTYADTVITLHGNLTITGSLTLSDVELVIDTPSNGGYGIVVEKDGHFTVLMSSVIHSWDASVHYVFQVRPEGCLRMNDSELHDCGWDDTANWTVNPFPDRGLYIDSDNVLITNCTISENNVGIMVDNGSAPSICNNTITQNSVSGIEVYSGSSPLIDGNNVSQNNYGPKDMWYYFIGGIAAESSSPIITNNTITGNCDVDGIYISGGSGAVVKGNRISGHIDSSGSGNYWGIVCFSDGVMIAGNRIFMNDNGILVIGGENTIEDNEIVDNDNPNCGIGIQEASMSVYRNNTVSGGTIAVLLWDGSASSFWNMTLTNATDGINGLSDQFSFNDFFYNCTFASNRHDVNIEAPWSGYYGGGTVTLVNPKYDPAEVRVVDDSGVVVVKWYVKVHVIYESDSRGVDGAEVEFKDARGTVTGPQKTGANGWTGAFLLTEYQLDRNGRTPLSPQQLSAVCGTRSNTTTVEVNCSADAVISLHDLPPALEILSPKNGTVTNQTSIVLRGQTEPGALVEVDGSRVEVSLEGGWKAELELAAEGANEIPVQAWDSMMNKASLTVVIFRDTIAPVITVDTPSENLLVNTSTILVSGSVNEPGASLTINGAPVTVGPDGGFNITVSLDEGRNTIELRCTDAAGNTATLQRHVLSDTLAPMLRLDSPSDGFATNASTVTATGAIETGAELTVNGVRQSTGGAAFSVTLVLTEGLNTFEFCARDRAGNINSTSVNVLRDSTQPALEILTPAENARFNTSTVVLTGTTDAGATVRVNGAAVQNGGGSFSVALNLGEGTSTIRVESWDSLLNLATRTVTVFVDTIPPRLEILGPAQNTLTNRTTVIVNGVTEPGATVMVAGKAAAVNAQGRFTVEVPLDAEGPNSIPVSASDGLNNTASAVLTVRRDTVVIYTISEPADGSRVKARNVTVSGKAEPGATVVVGGVSVPLGPDGSFSLVVPLSLGHNTIPVVINDTAGNYESLGLNVTRLKAPGGASSPLPDGSGVLTVLAVLTAVGLAGACLRRKGGKA